MGFLSALIFGFIVGTVARLFVREKIPGGCIVTAVLGMAGAFAGQFISIALGGPEEIDRWSVSGLVLSVLGAIAVVFVYHMLMKRKAEDPPR